MLFLYSLSVMLVISLSVKHYKDKWQRVNVEMFVIQKVQDTREINFIEKSNFYPAASGLPSKKYRLYCKKSDRIFKLHNIQVSPLYINKSVGMACYTKLQPDLAFGAVFTGSQVTMNREPSNLANGLNYKLHEQCANTQGDNSAWILMELISPKEIKQIVFTSDYSGWMEGKPIRLDIKFSLNGGNDFLRYEMIAENTGTMEMDHDFVVNVIPPKIAKHILFEKKKGPTDGSIVFLMICHLQVF